MKRLKTLLSRFYLWEHKHLFERLDSYLPLCWAKSNPATSRHHLMILWPFNLLVRAYYWGWKWAAGVWTEDSPYEMGYARGHADGYREGAIRERKMGWNQKWEKAL